ncbi:TPA: hypothetical protein ACHVWC_002250 [Klebsiella pneumoniae]|uniref:hypothetical protein n=1 Tax=Klebsiella pneumoniae TaxID=573 RepID=UPI001BD17583|nr:hypothetical protein [Klebsiella pneumoniae]HCA8934418.1 hypothetical protein [Klebsiella pneumoniae]HCE8731229.1 hypothetical protein [Klebsiella pneumoniae]
MTDITELAQRMKAAAVRAKTATEEYASGHMSVSVCFAECEEFNRLTDGPDNIIALVDALEKAQGMEAYWKTQCRGITDHCEELQARIAELESRTVKLSPELYTIGDLIRTQDNRITDQPMFVVFQKREIIGSDEHSPSRICWVWDGEEVSELRAKRLEALYQDGRDTRGYDRYAMQEVDEFVTACFTEHGCKDYLRQNGHNLRLPYIYACGSFRNNEYQLVRNWLAGIKVEAE